MTLTAENNWGLRKENPNLGALHVLHKRVVLFTAAGDRCAEMIGGTESYDYASAAELCFRIAQAANTELFEYVHAARDNEKAATP